MPIVDKHPFGGAISPAAGHRTWVPGGGAVFLGSAGCVQCGGIQQLHARDAVIGGDEFKPGGFQGGPKFRHGARWGAELAIFEHHNVRGFNAGHFGKFCPVPPENAACDPALIRGHVSPTIHPGGASISIFLILFDERREISP